MNDFPGHWIVKTCGRIPLRTLLIVPFVLQTVGVVALVGYLSYQSGQSAVENLAEQLIEQATNRIRDRLESSLQVQQQAVAVNHRAFQQRILNLNNFEQLRNHFWQQIHLAPSLAASSFANEQGEEIGYAYVHNLERAEQFEQRAGETVEIGTVFLHQISPNHPNQRNYYLVDDQGKPRKLVHTFAIDVRTTPWYHAGKATKQQTWSPIFARRDTSELAINAIAPIYKAGKFQGVFTNVITLTDFSTFLNHLNISPRSQTFILERSGDLVATSTLETFDLKYRSQKPVRLPAIQSHNAYTRAIAIHLQQQWRDLHQIQTPQQFKVAIEGSTLFAQVTPYRDAYGLDWLLVTVVPESDFMAQIHANTQRTLLLCGLALVFTITTGSLTARWITQPILHLNAAAKQLSGSTFGALTITSPVVELRELTDSFAEMAHQLHRSFEELAEQKAYLAHLLEILPVGVVIHDRDGVVTYFNQMAKQLLGKEAAPKTGTDELADVYQLYRAGTNQLYPAEELPALRALQGELVTLEDIAIHQPQQIVIFKVQAAPIFKQSQVVAAIVVFEDITAQKQTEDLMADYNQKLQQQVQELERLNYLKDDFLSTVSHELRTPMSSIFMATQMLEVSLQRLEPPEELGCQLERYLGILKQECQREIDLINDLLDLLRLEAEPDLLNLTSIDLPVWIPAIAEPFEQPMQVYKQQFQIHIPADLPPLATDLQYFKRILTELLQNACKYTPEGGEIVIRCEVTAGQKQATDIRETTQLGSLEPDTWDLKPDIFQISISNSGVEIPATELTNIFEKFYRIPNHDPWKQGGTGLGLALVKRMVSCLQGNIEAQSAENQTCFIVKLPSHQVDVPALS